MTSNKKDNTIIENKAADTGEVQKHLWNRKFGGLTIGSYLLLAIDFMFLLFFLYHKNIYSVIEDNTTAYYKKIFLFTIAFHILVAAIVIFFKRDKISPKQNKLLEILYCICSPIYAFIFSEKAAESNFSSGMGLQKILVDLLIIYIFLLILLIITNSMKWSAICIVTVCVIFSVANSFVYEFRGVPIMAADVTTIGTALDVASEYTLTWNFVRFIGFFSVFAFFAVGTRLKHTPLLPWKLRIPAVVLGVGIIWGFFAVFINSNFLEDNGVHIRMFRPNESYQTNGVVSTLIRSIQYAKATKPEGYSLEEVNKIIEEYTKDLPETSEPSVKPNIITVVNESFADISILGDVKTNEDYMPYIRSLKGKCITGTSYASILGGQTANTEFEFLTNNSMAFMPAQTVPFQLYVKTPLPSLVTSLKSQGYEGLYGLHMSSPNNYNRDAVYPLLGFSQFISRDNYSDYVDVNIEKRHNNASDLSTYEMIEQLYEKHAATSDAPFFMYDMTIQNHSPYDTGYNNLDHDITLDSKQQNESAELYLNLIKASDMDFQKLTEYFDKMEEPTVIIMFGDHQCKLDRSFLKKITNNKFSSWTDEEMMKRYTVPFVIWANYDIGTETIEKTSMNYLQTILLNAVGEKLTGYQTFLNKLQKQVPAITANGYFGADGKFYKLDDTSSPYYHLIWQYNVLQYNNCNDTKNRVDGFFDLKE